MKRVGLIKTLALVGAVMLGGMAARDAQASTVVFASFSDTAANQLSYSNSTGAVTATNAGATFTNLAGVIPYTGPVTYTLTATRVAGAAGDATLTGSTVSQALSGSIAFSSGSVNVLTATFTGAILAATNTSQSGGVTTDTDIIGQIINYQSSLQGTFVMPYTFSISLTTIPGLTIDNTNNLKNLISFQATAAGSFSEDRTGVGQGVPLPAAVWGGISLMGALGGIRAWGRRRRR